MGNQVKFNPPWAPVARKSNSPDDPKRPSHAHDASFTSVVTRLILPGRLPTAAERAARHSNWRWLPLSVTPKSQSTRSSSRGRACCSSTLKLAPRKHANAHEDTRAKLRVKNEAVRAPGPEHSDSLFLCALLCSNFGY